MNMKVVLISSIVIGGAAAVGIAIYLHRKNEAVDEGEEDVAYTYEDAVKKAKKRLAEGKEDGVKYIKSNLDMVSYHKITDSYSNEKIVEEDEPKNDDAEEFDPASIEKWPDEKDGAWYRISEDAFIYSEYTKSNSYVWDGKSPYLAYYETGEHAYEKDDELFKRVVTLSFDEDGPWWFANDEKDSVASVTLKQ